MQQGNTTVKALARGMRQSLFGVSGMWDDLKGKWDSAIADFQNARAQLDIAESQLYEIHDQAAQDPQDLADWQRAYDKVNAAMSTMDATGGAISTVSDWWNSAAAAVGLGNVKNGLAGALGFGLPAFPVTLGGLIALTAAAYSAVVLVQALADYLAVKYGRVEQLIAAGVEPEEAVRIAIDETKATRDDKLGMQIQKSVMWAAIGLACVFVLPKLIDGARR